MSKRIFVAKHNFHVSTEDGEVFVHKGTTVREGHPILRGRERMFRPLEVDFDLPEREEEVVETASAEPGTRRRPGRPKLPRDEHGNIIRESE